MPHAPTVGRPNDDYEARYDMETIQRAEAIRKDPNRLAKAKAYAAATAAELEKFAEGNGKPSAEQSLMQGYRKV